jgi:hypothetical protein
MANQIVNRQVNIYINSGDAQKALDKLIEKEKKLKDELSKATDPKRIKELNKELAKLSEPIDRAKKKLSGELLPTFRDLEVATRKWLNEFKRTGDPVALANFQKFNNELQVARQRINGLEDSQKRFGSFNIFKSAFWANLAAGGITAVTSQISNFLSTSVEEALEADRVTAQLSNTLDNLGRNDAFDRLIRKADQMADRFKFLDNDEVVAVFNKLIDYGKLTEKQMNDLLPVIIDFAAKTRQDLGSSTDVIIKALEGNGKALKQFGIDMKDAKTDGEALGLVMTELKAKVAGAAETFGRTAEGEIKSARQEFKNLKEEIGNGLIPVINKLLSIVNKGIRGLGILANAISDRFKGKASIQGSVILQAASNEDNARDSAIQADSLVAAFNENVKLLKERQKKGQLLDKTEADIRTELIKSYQQQKEQLDKQISVDAKNISALASSKDKQALLSLATRSNALQLAIDDLSAAQSTSVLGIKSKTGEKGSGTNKVLEDLKKLKEALAAFGLDDPDTSPMEKEIAALNEKFKELRELAHGNRQLLKEIDEVYYRELFEIQVKYSRLELKEFIEHDKKMTELRQKQIADQDKNFQSRSQEVLRRNANILQTVFDNTNRDRAAGLQLTALQATGRQKLQAELALLDEQRRQELQNKNLTENEILLIEEKFRQSRHEKEMEFEMARVETILNFASQATQILDTLFQAANAKDNAQLERDRKINEQKKNNFKKQLDGKMITQLQYDQQVRKLEKEQEKREYEAQVKQFNRNKITAIANAVINGAQGATKTIATLGFPAAIPFLVLEAAAVVAQIIAISKQKPAPPTFAKGGKLGGRKHSEGGNAVIDGSGQKIAEIEAGEGIINRRSMGESRRYTVSGTPSQIASSINSLYGRAWDPGASLVPQWRTISPQRMNFSAMKKMYASGGVFDNKPIAEDPQQINLAILTELTSAVNELRLQMKKPIKAYTRLTEHEDAQERLDTIRSEATIRG